MSDTALLWTVLTFQVRQAQNFNACYSLSYYLIYISYCATKRHVLQQRNSNSILFYFIDVASSNC